MSYIWLVKRKPALVWNDWNRAHIKKHSVTVREVQEGYRESFRSVILPNKREVFHSKLVSGRLLTIIVSYKLQLKPFVLSARDMSKKERRLYL